MNHSTHAISFQIVAQSIAFTLANKNWEEMKNILLHWKSIRKGYILVVEVFNVVCSYTFTISVIFLQILKLNVKNSCLNFI